MITRYLAAWLILVGMLLGQTVTAPPAEAAGIKGKWWNAPRVQRELGLSRGEMQALEQKNLEMRRQIIRNRSKIQENRAVLDSLLSRDSVNEGEIRRLNQEMSKAQAGISRAQSNFVVEVRKILGPRRFQKLKQLFRDFRKN
jgi:Spy/CpxP family protein refolding chaperone